MKLKQLSLALAAVLVAPAYASVANGTSGNGELFLAVYDEVAKVSYIQDLGITQNTFFVDAQRSTGYTKEWDVTDPNWTAFLGKVNLQNTQWTVLATETTGGTAVGGSRLFTTAKAGEEGLIGTMTNLLYTNATGSSQLGTLFSALNNTGTHGTVGVPLDNSIHGTSVNADTDPGNAYFGIPGSGPRLNGNAPFSSGNAIGTESFFYYLTRSGANQLGTVLVDQFDNTDNPALKGVFMLDGPAGARTGYALSYNLAAVPEPQTYALVLLGLAGVAFAARRRSRR